MKIPLDMYIASHKLNSQKQFICKQTADCKQKVDCKQTADYNKNSF